ncbi:MAG: ASKHA domain-containing protein [Candidatus Hermodarchaeota archaeon]
MKKYNSKILIDFEPISRRVYLFNNLNIYEILTEIRIPIQTLCGGMGTCGKCKLLIQKGNEFLIKPTKIEEKFLSKEEIKKGWRLACQARINPNNIEELEEKALPQFRIYLPDELVLEDFKILTSGANREIELYPAVKKLYLEVKKPSLEEPISDFERLLFAIKGTYKIYSQLNSIHINIALLNKLSKILRENDHKLTITLWNNNAIIDIEPGNTTENNFGVAFDIGTTTLVGYLINLNNGKIYSVASKLNQQTAFGEDVITRLTYVKNNPDGLKKLNSSVIEGLNDIILKMCKKSSIDPSNIYEGTIVGNSVMHHLFLGINPISIGLSPYVPLIQKALNIDSKELNLHINENGTIYTAPLIAGFVGADTMGVALSSNIENEKELTLVIDIGTNGEIIVGNREILATGSCAAGSALEGAHIAHGMRAAAGAIDTIKIDSGNLEVSYTTIKNKDPIGICGSGLIDAVAEMLKSNILTRNGNFNKNLIGHKRIRKTDHKFEFIIAHENETSIRREITISQNDIRQIQMAKAAFYAGSRLILKDLKELYKLSDTNIKQIFLAGAFGNYIDKENAKFIGMIPDIPNDKIYQIGNAAGVGAQYCLMNTDMRKKANLLLKKIKYVEISLKKEFQREYAEAMYFPHLNLNYFPNLMEYNNIPKR